MRIVELQPGEVVRPACLPQQAELKVRTGCKLVPSSKSEPVLVEHFLIIPNVKERLVVDIDEVGTRLYGFVVQRYDDLKAVASPVGIFGLPRPIVVHSSLIEPALLESESMLKCCACPGLLDGELLIEPVLDDISVPVVPIIKWTKIDAHVAKTAHRPWGEVVVSRTSQKDLTSVRGELPMAYFNLGKEAPAV